MDGSRVPLYMYCTLELSVFYRAVVNCTKKSRQEFLNHGLHPARDPFFSEDVRVVSKSSHLICIPALLQLDTLQKHKYFQASAKLEIEAILQTRQLKIGQVHIMAFFFVR